MPHPHQLVREAFPSMFPEQPNPGPLGAFLAKLRLSADDIRRIQADEVEVTVTLRERIKKLFDQHGVRIRPTDSQYAVTTPDRKYRLEKPQIDYAARLARLAEYFGPINMAASEFEERAEAIRTRVATDEQLGIRNIVLGVALPVVLPRIESGDYGQILEDKFLAAAERSYKQQFPERVFTNYRKGELREQVTIVPGSRHNPIVAQMTVGEAVGLLFPASLQGYSVLAQREQMQSLPERFHLVGGFDGAVAQIMYPDVLARDSNTPLYDLSALQWQSSEYSLFFRADGGKLRFDGKAILDYARSYYSGGLLVLG